MSFCSNCGKLISSGSRFCSDCGTPVASSGTNNIRKEVFVGEVRKCPACSAEVKSFTAFCPDCGHEFNSRAVPSHIVDFINRLQMYDNAVINYVPTFAPTIQPKRVPRNNGKERTPFIYLVLIAVGIVFGPLLIPYLIEEYFFYILILVYFFVVVKIEISLHRKALNAKAREKASFISNYVFTTDREVILEALSFVKDKLIEIESDTITRSSFYWAKIWKKKAIALHKKAKLLMKKDDVENSIYNEITESSSKIYRSYTLKCLTTFLLELLPIIALFIISKTRKNIF